MNDSGKDKRRRWRAYHARHDAIFREWEARGYQYPPPVTPPFPDDLRDLACGAKTRAGTPCKLTSIYANGRCKLHGGMSTGPTSAEGKARAAENGK
jgi:hypothetical protein